MSRAEQHSREVIEADRAELLAMIRQPVDPGHGSFGDDDYRPPMQSESCLGCGSDLHGGNIPQCAVCGRLTPWRDEYGRYIAFEQRVPQDYFDRAYAIRTTFGISPMAYETRVARMLDDPRALTVDAVTVRRLIRRRDEQRSQRGGAATPRPVRPNGRQRPLPFATSSPASAPTSTPDVQRAEDPAESRSTAPSADTPAPSTVDAAGDATLPDPATSSWASEGRSGEPSGGVRARVENDRVWGRRDRLRTAPRPLGDTLRILLAIARDLWRNR